MKARFLAIALFALASTGLSAKDLVVVVGGSGQSGIEVVKLLTESGQYDVRATARDVGSAQERHGDEIDWVAVDVLNADQTRAAFDGADFVISTIGSVSPAGPNAPEFIDYGGIKSMVSIAQEQGVKQFVLMSAAGAGNADHLLNVAFSNVLVWKWLGEDYLRDSGLPYTVVRPTALRNEPVGQRGVLFGPAKSFDLGYIARADVAAVMIAALENPGALSKTIEVIGDDDAAPSAWHSHFASIPVDGKPEAPAEYSDGQ